MAIIGLQRIAKKDLFTDTLWNALMDILEAKFSSGVGTNDIQYPLIVQGDIDFGRTYGIVGLRKFWNIVNAAEYTTFDAAVSAAEATAGGAVFIPAYTTISANAVSIDSGNVTIFGAGRTSVLKITAAATGPLLTTATSGLSNITLMNFAMDGTGGGAACIGVSAKRVDSFQMLNMYMTAFTGDFIHLTNSGVAGQSCTNAYLHNVHCNAGGDNHLVADDISGLMVTSFLSKGAANDAISMVPAGSTNLIQYVTIANSRIQSGGGKAVRIVGSGAAGIDAHSVIRLNNVHAIAMTGTPFELGATSALLKDTQIIGCSAPAAVGNALRIASDKGLVGVNQFPSAGSDAIDMTNSVDVQVHGNNCKAATAYGVNATSTTTCVVTGNNLTGSLGVLGTTSTGLVQGNNPGTVAHAPASMIYYENGSDQRTAVGDFTFVHTIKAGTVRVGDRVTVRAMVEKSGTVETVAVSLKIGAAIFGSTGTIPATPAANYTAQWDVTPQAVSGDTNGVITVVGGPYSTSNVSAGANIDWAVDNDVKLRITAISGATNIIAVSHVSIIFNGTA